MYLDNPYNLIKIQDHSQRSRSQVFCGFGFLLCCSYPHMHEHESSQLLEAYWRSRSEVKDQGQMVSCVHDNAATHALSLNI